MADANHNAPALVHDCFVTPQASFRHRRTIPHLRFSDRAPPVLYLWMKLSGQWIEGAGFEPEQRLQIEVTHKRLVITPIDEIDGDPVGKDGVADVDRATRQQRRQFPVMTREAQ
ncbi:SymE family type I addiction module toxin [Burkholderia pyrrocinia]|uniref:SymE family type I addiction module toxin n=1 Tax=Burkholderia pyrrocinia TaxID=60550 RepID=UPI001BD1A196|nr:SymE family type I addiction module toxin [Burkholderia pyrrocinia]QVN20213.1 SymE family type I addiction module toxin [Burkholderia pyrrocinia]